jgi:hypothetical protein
MIALPEILDEMVTRNKTKKLNTSFIRAEFHRACCAHFTAVVLPELRRFERHLGGQGVIITVNSLHLFNKNVLRAGLTIVYPADISNVLEIRYDFQRRNLALLQVINGLGRSQADIHYSFETFAKVTAPKVWDAIECFAQAVFGAKLL